MTKKVIVAKFGGSSMADAEAMRRSAKVALQNKANVIVVSATYGTTNQLIELLATALIGKWNKCFKMLKEIRERHETMAHEFNANETELAHIDDLLKQARTLSRGVFLIKDCAPKVNDTLVGLGERLSSAIFTLAMKESARSLKSGKEIELYDIREVMITTEAFGKAEPYIEDIKENCNQYIVPKIKNDIILVTQGFVGKSKNGFNTTLGRGGSDYSAALVAEGISADLLQIWTDVAGISTTDPRICNKARPLSEITFTEAAELATFGAKILHPTTLTPATRANISVFVGSSYDPEKEGTWIRKQTESTPLVRAMAIKKNQCLLTLSTPDMLHSHDFLYSVFHIFNRHKVSVDLITTSEVSLSLTLDDATMLNDELVQDLSLLADVKFEQNFSLVSIIGNKINLTQGLARDVFKTLEDINIRMICQGASKHHFCFLLDASQGEKAINLLHKFYIESDFARLEQ
jgi:aspartate kinase